LWVGFLSEFQKNVVEHSWRMGKKDTHGAEEKCTEILVGRPEGRRPLGRPRHRYDDNIKTDLTICLISRLQPEIDSAWIAEIKMCVAV
jgi:hypothetical protein